ncbi:MAG: GntR family transcriptional regulator [Paracoccaceae bacterium]|nr:GntR family transcriptional regulator [Paracoccaceae bacterium]MDE2915074.1 GntR family transcriptional regulator [Paracoccaceae bacterium]
MYYENDSLPQTLSYFILNKLRWRIITGELAPGQALREQELEADYGSSRGPVRESLRLLLRNGLVEHLPRRGFRVRKETRDDVRNIYELRAALEGMVIAALSGLDIGPLCETLQGRCAIMEGYYKANDVEGYFRENSTYHQCIIDFTGNRPIAQVLYYVNEISLPIRYKLLKEAFPTRRSLDYHEEILRQLKAGDIQAAKRLTQEHILDNLERAMASFDENESTDLT